MWVYVCECAAVAVNTCVYLSVSVCTLCGCARERVCARTRDPRERSVSSAKLAIHSSLRN